MIRARLYLFGEQTLIAGPSPHDRPVDPGPPQQRLLLAYLALHPGQPVDRRKLAFTLWPDTTEAAARRTLRQQLHRLRQILASLALPPETLVSRGGQLFFNPGANLWIDVREFERQIFDPRWQIEAIELHRAELLPDRQADWLQPLRSDLREKYMAALRSQIDIANMQRNYPRAPYYAHRLLQADPLRESSHRIYMEALYCSGQRSEALQHFTRLTQRLKSELNVAPTLQTVDLYRQIQRGALPGDIPPLMVSPRHMPQAIRQVARLGTSFVGQRDALARLDEALAQTLNGWGQLVIVKGTSGAGKTCLVQTWRQMRAESMLALTGHCAP
ncbi:MAG: BTAD domain-containing putative transcriptional regulator, partial [Anaerolineae bacterium]